MGLTSIKEAAFCESNLTELIIPEGVTEIEDYLLLDAKKLTKLVIPSTIEHMGRWLIRVTAPDVHGNPIIAPSIPDVTLVLREGIKEIAPSAFWGSAIKEVTIPSTVTVIPRWCFSNSRLEKIKFHDDITRIEGWAFENCLLKFEGNKLIVPKKVKVLGPFAFYLNVFATNEIILNDELEVLYQDVIVTGITNTTLEIPASVKRLYRGTLILEGGLEKVIFNGEAPPLSCKNFNPNNISFHAEIGEYDGPLDNATPSIEIPQKEKYKIKMSQKRKTP